MIFSQHTETTRWKGVYFLLPLLYLAAGGFVSSVIVDQILSAEIISGIPLYLPLLAVTVFITVMGIVNVWVRWRLWSDDDSVVSQIYTFRRLLWLYLKAWGVLMSGLVLLVLFLWMQDFIPFRLSGLFDPLRTMFYVFCIFLTLVALFSVVQGENLEEIRLRQAQIENQQLKSQLNPHFLYNTLNNIDALIWLDQEKASSSVNRLSKLMRYFTYCGRQEWVRIGEEAEHLQQLIELQRLRMSHEDSLIFRADIDCPETQIPPLMLIPIIENCFKHCGNLNEPQAIVIRLALHKKRLTLETDNNLPLVSEASQSQYHGLGIMVLRRRLSLLYSNSYILSMGKERERYKTCLTLDLA